MFRTVGDQPSLWESLLPEEVLRLPTELARVDALLDDPAFFAPFAAHFDPLIGRPSTPMECYLRLMFLKFRYRLGYESLCAEVADSISWRRFCRIPLDGKVPHPTTLMKLTTRRGMLPRCAGTDRQPTLAGRRCPLSPPAAGPSRSLPDRPRRPRTPRRRRARGLPSGKLSLWRAGNRPLLPACRQTVPRCRAQDVPPRQRLPGRPAGANPAPAGRWPAARQPGGR
jgi:hypothetical protein